MTTNIYLLGMPSSGKSTLGRPLAKELNYRFLDMDEIIETREGKTISEIFRDRGEDYFRKAESEVLKRIPQNDALIVATGGGTPCFFDNMEFIKKAGISIFLHVKPEEIAARILKSEANNRPLVNKENPNQMLDELKERYQNRLPFYRQATLEVEGDIHVDHLIMTLQAMGVIG